MKILLITPPLTQLNTPYPATTYLKGFLNQFDYVSAQADLGIELVNSLFSQKGLQSVFNEIERWEHELSAGALLIVAQQQTYLSVVETVVEFLQGKHESLSHRICSRTFLPEGNRFAKVEDLEWAFGTMGVRDKARFLATLFIEDIGDLIRETVSPYFAFTRYAEQISRSAGSFNELEAALQEPTSLIDQMMLDALDAHIRQEQPGVIGFSVPFPGNLFGALRCGQFIKAKYPHIKTIMGGGYPNTELRSLKNTRVFNYIDYITLDDGEAPVLQLLKYFGGKIEKEALKRTYLLENNELEYIDNNSVPDFPHAQVGTPDYSGLPLDKYLSVIEVANPMHRLWSDGRWNKLTLAHGCYWHRCTFCDVALDYIKRFDQTTASQIVDRIEALITQTGENGFHFTDEAAPPLLLRDLSLEIIRRKLNISWWTNVRFEKTYSHDLARLMAASGCIAVSGGLEVASDRLLKLIKKGTNIKQVTKVTRAFTEAGIMVHAYLMYGFPTQTAQETIDSLEVVRQLFEQGLIQSGFWHQFTMTVHSPVGISPDDFRVKITGPAQGTFANNDLQHSDPEGANHEQFAAGLNKAIYNFMHDVGFDLPIQDWFDFRIPRVSVSAQLILSYLELPEVFDTNRLRERPVWIGTKSQLLGKPKKGKVKMLFYTQNGQRQVKTTESIANWIFDFCEQTKAENQQLQLSDFRNDFEEKTNSDFEVFLFSKEWNALRESGLLLVR